MVRKYPAAELPPKGHFYYHQGVFLSGVLKPWRLTGDPVYLNYVAEWLDSVFTADGQIIKYDLADLDDIQPGILLYTLYDATRDEKYLACLDSVAAQIKDIPRCECGGFYHKVRFTRQIKLIADRVDLISCNYQEQWYDRIHELIPDKAILGTETFMYFRGQDHILQNYSDENPWWDVEKRDYVIGGMIWTGIDYLGESIGYPAKGWSGALFSTDMEKRPIAWVHQSNWTKEPVVRFAVMDYTIPCNQTKEGWGYPRYETHWEFPQFQGVVLP